MDGFKVDAEAGGNTRPESLDQDITFIGKLVEDLFSFIAFEIEAQMLFVPVEAGKKQIVGLKSSVFDTDNLCPMVSQQHRAIGTGQQPGKVQDPDTRETSVHICSPLVVRTQHPFVP